MAVSKEFFDQIKQFRKQCTINDDKRDEGLPHDIPEVKRIDNLHYGPDPKWNALDIYLPNNVKPPYPTIVYIHGGGWCYGTKDTFQYYGMGLAKYGFAVANASYHLAPENGGFPAELNEVDQYIQWLDDHADEYHFDRNNFFITGDSAGGQLAEQYAAILSEPAYAKLYPYKPLNLKFRAAAFNCAATFVLTPAMSGPESIGRANFTPESVKKYHKQLATESYIDKNFLPTYLLTANKDIVHDYQMMLYGLMLGRGVEVICKSYGTDKNPRYHGFFTDQKDHDLAKKANDGEMAFFKDHIVK